MRNHYPGRRAAQAHVRVKVLGLGLRDAEYGSLMGIGYLFAIGLTSALKRAFAPRA